jgi:hypothetical protein
MAPPVELARLQAAVLKDGNADALPAASPRANIVHQCRASKYEPKMTPWIPQNVWSLVTIKRGSATPPRDPNDDDDEDEEDEEDEDQDEEPPVVREPDE